MLTLSGKRLGVALGAVLLVGGAGGAFLSGWRKARGLEATESASADAGVLVQVDAGVHVSEQLQFHLGDWTAVRLPPPSRPAATPAGPTPVCTCPDPVVLVPNVSFSGSTEAQAELQQLAQARAGAAATVEERKQGLQLTWGAGGGVQHDDTTSQPLIGARLGLRWGDSEVMATGGVAPLSPGHWNVLVLYGGAL